MQQTRHAINVMGPTATASGRVRIEVLQDGEVIQTYPWQNNLILDQGLNNVATARWRDQIAYCCAGTGTTPTKDVPVGTYDQSGTTVTRQTGSVDFIAGDVGKLLRFSTGEEAYITALLGVTQVTVSISRTVAATSIILYRVAQTGLAAESERVNTYPAYSDPDTSHSQTTIVNAGAGTVTLRRTYDFAVRGSNINYTEVGISPSSGAGNNLFSRILLTGAVTVLTGQSLRVRYELTLKHTYAVSRPSGVAMSITGWPRPYNISSITSTVSNFTVTLAESHHFLAGGKININGALPPIKAITAASSTPTEFTITSAAHGYSGGQSIVIAGVTPSGYNGTWTIASVTTDTITVTSAVNPGPGTVFGTVRRATPGTWYDGEWTIASVTSTTVVVTSAINPIDAGASGTAYNNTKALTAHSAPLIRQVIDDGTGTGAINGYRGQWNSGAAISSQDWLYDGFTSANPVRACMGTLTAAPAFAYNTNQAAGSLQKNMSAASYVAGSFERIWTVTFNAGEGNSSTIRDLSFNRYYDAGGGPGAIPLIHIFEEPQRKDNTHSLALTLTLRWNRDLSGGAS